MGVWHLGWMHASVIYDSVLVHVGDSHPPMWGITSSRSRWWMVGKLAVFIVCHVMHLIYSARRQHTTITLNIPLKLPTGPGWKYPYLTMLMSRLQRHWKTRHRFAVLWELKNMTASFPPAKWQGLGVNMSVKGISWSDGGWSTLCHGLAIYLPVPAGALIELSI